MTDWTELKKLFKQEAFDIPTHVHEACIDHAHKLMDDPTIGKDYYTNDMSEFIDRFTISPDHKRILKERSAKLWDSFHMTMIMKRTNPTMDPIFVSVTTDLIAGFSREQIISRHSDKSTDAVIDAVKDFALLDMLQFLSEQCETTTRFSV